MRLRLVAPGSWKGVFDHITYGCFKVLYANWTLTVADYAVDNASAVVHTNPNRNPEGGWEVCWFSWKQREVAPLTRA